MLRKVIVFGVASLFSANVMATGAGDWLMRVGLGHVNTDTSSNDLVVGGDVLPDARISVGNNTRPIVTLTYMATDHIGFDLLAAWPFDHDIDGAGILEGAGKLGDTKHLPPTFSVQYHMMPGAPFRPYAGIGLNYTNFFSSGTTPALEEALGGPSSLSISDSWGVALQVGADFDITDQLFMNLDIRWIQIEADASIRTQTDAGEVRSRIKADIDPFVFSASVGFRF